MSNIIVKGTITCRPDERDWFVKALSEHIRLSRAEPGNIEFDITPSAPGSCTFEISERFVNGAAFEAHTKRTRASDWWHKTQHIPRNLSPVPK